MALPLPMLPIEKQTEEHLLALTKADTDRLLKWYASDALCITSTEILTGTDEIRLYFERFYEKIFRGSKICIHPPFISGSQALVDWWAESVTHVIPFASSGLFVQEKCIIRHTLSAKLQSKTPFPPARTLYRGPLQTEETDFIMSQH